MSETLELKNPFRANTFVAERSIAEYLSETFDLVGLDVRLAFAIYCFTIDSDSPLFICQLQKPNYE